MNHRIATYVLGSVAALAVAVAAPAVSLAAPAHHGHHHAVKSNTNASGNPSSSETALTGSTLGSASSAALAAVPGTVDRATTEAEGSGAYEVIVAKSDGTHVKVIEDASFNVLSSAPTHCG